MVLLQQQKLKRGSGFVNGIVVAAVRTTLLQEDACLLKLGKHACSPRESQLCGQISAPCYDSA